MDLVSNLSDVKPGDGVVASGVDGIFPKGYQIGRVERVERGAGLYLHDHRQAGGGFLEPGRSARRADPASRGDPRRGRQVKTAVVIIAIAAGARCFRRRCRA